MNIKDFCKENLSESQLRFLKQLYDDTRFAYRRIVPPELVLKKRFKERMGYTLNLDNPKTFNEKLQWLKLHDHNPLYTTMVDKYAVKKYVADKIGEQYIIPTLGVWEHFDEIDFDKLPNQFVLKCTHDSGSIVVVTDKSKMDKVAAKDKLEHALRYNYYYWGYEWPYKNVPPRIIAEKFMVDESSGDLKDYKVFNFNGIPKAIQVDYDRFTNHKRNIYDAEWKYIDMSIEYPTDANRQIAKPKNLETMLELAGKLSEGIPHARTDFYIINDDIYFGEITFYHGAGLEHFMPEKYDDVFGEWIKLPNVSRGGNIIVGDGFYLWIHKGEPLINVENNNILVNTQGLIDYKFYCFNGTPKFLYISQGLEGDHTLAKMNFLDMEWKLTPFQRSDFMSFGAFDMPECPEMFAKMAELAEIFSKDIPFLRVDMYVINGQIYMSEFTFYPGAGFTPFEPFEWEEKIGSWIKLK